jgi:hypothetical protein
MVGYNYEVCFGIELFDNCDSYDTLQVNLKSIFPNSQPEHTQPIEVNREIFWEEITYGLDFRGGGSVSLILDDIDKQKVKKEQTEYTSFLKHFITPESKIFSYPDSRGIPGYPVFWEYRFIIFNETGQCLFTFGSSSD